MKKTNKIVEKLLEELEKTPLIQIACEKVGISRNTFYRWMKEDNEFTFRVSEAVSIGTGLVSDVALSNVLEGIKRKDSMYTKYWLSHKHPDFRRPFVFKVDSDDFIANFRSVADGIKRQQIAEDISNKINEEERMKREKAVRKSRALLDRWEEVLKTKNENEAKELFEKWKKEHLDKNNNKDIE